MDDRIRRALSRGHLIDITTTGRKTGEPRRIELVFHNFGGRIYITGRPGPRAWYANVVSNPRFTFHLKGPIKADLAAIARAITDEAERRQVFAEVVKVWRGMDPEVMARRSPLIEVTIDEAPDQEPGRSTRVA